MTGVPLKSLGDGLYISDNATASWTNLGIRIIEKNYTLHTSIHHEDLFSALDWQGLATYAEDRRDDSEKRINEIEKRLSKDWDTVYRNQLEVEKELFTKREVYYAHMRVAFEKLAEVFGAEKDACDYLNSKVRQMETR